MKEKRVEKYSERFDNDKSEIGNPDTWGKRVIEEPKPIHEQIIDSCGGEERFKEITGLKPRQEIKFEDLFNSEKKNNIKNFIMEKQVQKLPKWFDGEVYDEGSIVTNPYSGESIELNNLELSMYDFIKGSEFVLSSVPSDNLSDLFYKGLDWFKENNIKAYITLLD